MSSIVAVAGGTGMLGRAILDQIVASRKYQVFVLGREASDAKSKELGAKIIAIDYSNVSPGADPEMALIKAADKSSATKRYIPSLWRIKHTPEAVKIFGLAEQKLAYLNALEKTSLEYTAVINGMFTDYYVEPHVKSYITGMTLAVDMKHKAAAIPGSGNVPVVFTYSFDIGNFIAALLSQSSWEKESYIIGDKMTWNEFLAIAEEARGAKFDTTYDSLDKLKSFQVTELPANAPENPYFPKQMLQAMCPVFGIIFEEGHFDFKPEKTLNDQFPEIKPRKVKDLLEEAWKGK
ncbi:NAD(P)-binding protein [Bimuria novae-zelandiae CBS 107.79]|uniref:NAD(P)-binding protein n=1 Tax=Bimuria novae-zelandiae CBS 107.79 TaxID=1447943 RepID=A0A6A5VBV1_9PLEO|nr:NAD(P)-binding protein [Bimuria novae-zelandiae CBS 107.79]